MLIAKQRAVLPWESVEQVCGDGAADLPLAQFSWALQRHRLRPKALVLYERQAWESPDRLSYLRITADRCVRAGLSESLFGMPAGEVRLSPGEIILELKFERAVPYWLYAILRKHGLQRQAYSKYHGAGELLEMDGPGPATFLKERQWTSW